MSTPQSDGDAVVVEKEPIYLDYNATTPVHPEVMQAMLPYLQKNFGNPSSSHYYGLKAKKAIEHARDQVSQMLECERDEIVFTSGGSECNNYAIKGVAYSALRNRSNPSIRPHIITSKIEHPSVLEVCKYLQSSNDFDVSLISVGHDGLISLQELENSILPETCLITIMHANNETGVIQPIKQIVEIAKRKMKSLGSNLLIHSDASQSVGKIPVTIPELGMIDLLTLCSHKFYGPKGVGALYMKRGVSLHKQIHGANHEQNLRAGTENVLEIVGLGKACELVKRDLQNRMEHMKSLRDRLYKGLVKGLGKDYVKVNGHFEKRLPNTLSISFPYVEANTLLDAISTEVAASAGAACHSADDISISYTLSEMKIPVDIAMGTIRFSTGMLLTEEQVDHAIKIITENVKLLKPEVEEFDINNDDVNHLNLMDQSQISLTSTTRGLGCGCKIGPKTLEFVLKSLPPQPYDPNILVGNDTADDAAVYKLTDSIAVVHTVDFFTPIVDDPQEFGAISCANALSDVYAMGAKPTTALNIVTFPVKRLSLDILKKILLGAQHKANEAGVSILGGHTIDDTEPKFGLCVTGVVHPDKIWKNSTPKPGDVLILTKPIGVGLITTGMKRKLVSQQVANNAIKSMSTLNKYACDIMLENNYTVNACSDITGFGLLGHLNEMVSAHEDLQAIIYSQSVPIIDGAYDLVSSNIIPGGTKNNYSHMKDRVLYDDNMSEATRMILCDAQTSGGLLLSVPENEASTIVDKLMKADRSKVIVASIIGRIVQNDNEKSSQKIFVKNSIFS